MKIRAGLAAFAALLLSACAGSMSPEPAASPPQKNSTAQPPSDVNVEKSPADMAVLTPQSAAMAGHAEVATVQVTIPSPANQTPPRPQLPKTSITPLTTFSDFDPGAENFFPGAYTRLVVNSDISSEDASVTGAPPATANGENEYFSYKTRDIFRRLFWGLHTSLNLTANVKIGGSASAFTATVPLISMDHVSDSSNGEQFTRVVAHRAENFPLFLVHRDGSNAIVSVTFDLKASDTPSSSAAANALAVAQSVTKLVAPQAAVLTTLSQQSTQQVANALDQAVNKLFTTSIEEQPLGERDIRTWTPGKGLTVGLRIPAEGKWTELPTSTIGTWTVTFADPQPSIFDSIQICSPPATAQPTSTATPPQSAAEENPAPRNTECLQTFQAAAVQAEIDTSGDAASVLNFHLVNGGNDLGTISAYLTQQSWFTSATTAFVKAAPKQEDVTALCRSIKSSMTALGLNDVDAGIVTVAVGSMNQIPSAAANLMKVPDCAYAYPVSPPSGTAASPATPAKPAG